MQIIINNSSMVPLYEQIAAQIRAQVRSGELGENDGLPSVRALSRELRISALTVKKAYDNLEAEGVVVTVHGKGTYIAAPAPERIADEQRREVEADLEHAIRKGKGWGLSGEELRTLFELLLEEI